MSTRYFDIGVVVERRQVMSRWADHVWMPFAVLPAVPSTPPGTALPGDRAALYYAGGREIALYAGATAHYRDNLTSERPSVWVALSASCNGYDNVRATVDPYEGEALASEPGTIVEALAMPEEIQAALWDFVSEFHIEQLFVKRKRDTGAGASRASAGPGERR